MGLAGRSLFPWRLSSRAEEPILGATALEALGFAVDPVEKRLVPRDLLAL